MDAYWQGMAAHRVARPRPPPRLRRARAAARSPRDLRWLHEFHEADGISAQGGRPAWTTQRRLTAARNAARRFTAAATTMKLAGARRCRLSRRPPGRPVCAVDALKKK